MQERRQWQAILTEAIYQNNREGFLPVSNRRLTGEQGDDLRRRILNRLKFPEMKERHQNIAVAHQKTFQWIYQDPKADDRPWASFVQWLE